MKKKAFLITLGMIISTGLSPVLAESYKGLKFTETLYDFGQVGVDLKVFHDFKMYNDGDKPVKVDSVEVPCECSAIVLRDSTVNPGDTIPIKLTYETTHFYGPTRKSITVHASDGRATTLQFISDVGRWPKGLQPDHPFLFFIPGQKPKNIKIKNTAFEEYEITRIEPYDTVFQVTVLEKKAGMGKEVAMEIKPHYNLNTGTYQSCFRVVVSLAGEKNPFFLTIPVKIVVY